MSNSVSRQNSGLIQVVKKDKINEQEDLAQDPLMVQLANIPQCVPIWNQVAAQPTLPLTSTLSWESLVTTAQQAIKKSKTSVPSKQPLKPEYPTAWNALTQRCQTHMKTCLITAQEDQKKLRQRLVHMDEYCAKLSNTISNRRYQAKVYSEQMASLSSITKLLEKVTGQFKGILDLVETINHRLPDASTLKFPPSLDASPTCSSTCRYPSLTRALKSKRSKTPDAI